MSKCKILIFCLLCTLLIFKNAHAQQKEWKILLNLLQKEAGYFEGKNGFIQLGKSDYNTFTIEKAFVNDSLIIFSMWLRDRFGDEPSEQFLEEVIILEPESYLISAEIFYDFSYYFKDFPKTQFLRLEFDQDMPMKEYVFNIYKDLKTGKEDSKRIEDKTTRILLPIRAKNRTKILNAIDEYQRNSLKPQLDYESSH